MKIWQSFGSEHSSNLVMIGKFEDVEEAEKAKTLIKDFIEKVDEERQEGNLEFDQVLDYYPDNWLEFLQEKGISYIQPNELEQFAYEVDVTLEDENLVITTDEIDIIAFLKLLLNQNAKVEVFSAHHHDSEYGR